MKRNAFFCILIVLCTCLNAQTVYHYKKVAYVDLKTEEKVSTSGSDLHVIFTPSMACLCSEDGEIKEEEKELNIENSVLTERKYGNQYHFNFVRSENGMNVYSAHYYHFEERHASVNKYVSADYTVNDIDTYKYLYVSSDKQRINVASDTKKMREKGKSGRVYIYELYDSNPVGSAHSGETVDPKNLHQMF